MLRYKTRRITLLTRPGTPYNKQGKPPGIAYKAFLLIPNTYTHVRPCKAIYGKCVDPIETWGKHPSVKHKIRDIVAQKHPLSETPYMALDVPQAG